MIFENHIFVDASGLEDPVLTPCECEDALRMFTDQWLDELWR